VKVPFDQLCSGKIKEQVVDDGEAMVSLVALYRNSMASPLIFATCDTACNMHEFLF
jgi:predicted neutral ceramidase superfamily lipid hydrolase